MGDSHISENVCYLTEGAIFLLLCNFNVFYQQPGSKEKISNKNFYDKNQGSLSNKDNILWIHTISGQPNVQSMHFYVAKYKNTLPMNEECKPQNLK